jgi:hypothetical protein
LHALQIDGVPGIEAGLARRKRWIMGHRSEKG